MQGADAHQEDAECDKKGGVAKSKTAYEEKGHQKAHKRCGTEDDAYLRSAVAAEFKDLRQKDDVNTDNGKIEKIKKRCQVNHERIVAKCFFVENTSIATV